MTSLHQSRSEADTFEIARQLGACLDGGAVVLLLGDLGAGKTVFVRGLVDGTGGDAAEVSSPTFTLVQPYRGTLTVQHVDLYRLRSTEVDDLGLEELSTPLSVVAIEWANRLPRRPEPCVSVHITDQGGEAREIRIDGAPDAFVRALEP